jgi:two-component system cell cycle response regulator
MNNTAPGDAAAELHADQFVPVELYPDIACSRAGTRGTIELRTIAHDRAPLGRLAISLTRPRTADDFETIALFVRELSHTLALASLLESTQQRALTDPLTGLGNRRSAASELRRFLAESSRYGTQLSVAVLDVDHFKRVNDTMGYDVGDMVLKAVARVIASEIDRSDLAIRWGGEEFLIVLPHSAPQRARAVCDAMYQAKREGRNRVCVVDATLDEPERAPPPARARGRRRSP